MNAQDFTHHLGGCRDSEQYSLSNNKGYLRCEAHAHQQGSSHDRGWALYDPFRTCNQCGNGRCVDCDCHNYLRSCYKLPEATVYFPDPEPLGSTPYHQITDFETFRHLMLSESLRPWYGSWRRNRQLLERDRSESRPILREGQQERQPHDGYVRSTRRLRTEDVEGYQEPIRAPLQYEAMVEYRGRPHRRPAAFEYRPSIRTPPRDPYTRRP